MRARAQSLILLRVPRPKFQGCVHDCPFGLDACPLLRLAGLFFIDINACFGRGETMRPIVMRFVRMLGKDKE